MTQRGHQPDYFLIGLFAGLLLFGLVILSSASAPLGYQKFQDPYYFIKHQLLTGLLPGLILFVFFSRFHYQKLNKLAISFLIFSIVLLILVFIPGLQAEYGSARSWLNIFGFSVQPSEIVKLTFLIYLAAWLNNRGEQKVQDLHSSFVPFIAALSIISLLIILQPDLGTLSIIIVAAVTVYFVGGGNLRHLAAMGAAGLAAFLLLIKIAPYRMNRFIAFWSPGKDTQDVTYHLWQSLIAIGSGGFLGLGLGHSRQKFSYLPEVSGDSIFAIMGEELGFIFTCLFIILIIMLAYRGIQLAKNAPDRFSRLLVVGIIATISFQAFINMAGLLALMPMTGIPLPLVSAGGTAMMTTLASAGILVNISRFSKV
ncbi:MAG: putative lipid II flippase FtsW [Patescibacteria group bacterium]|jgi:cell division protein FtsW